MDTKYKDLNMGKYNVGYRNVGNYNIGSYNSGNYNIGHNNSGNYNSGNYNSGFFNSKTPKICFFDKLSDMTFDDFYNSIYWRIIETAPYIKTEWIEYTEEEKQKNKGKQFTGGYYKEHTYNENGYKIWWSNLCDKEKKIIKSMPNFNAKIFVNITGIQF